MILWLSDDTAIDVNQIRYIVKLSIPYENNKTHLINLSDDIEVLITEEELQVLKAAYDLGAIQ